MSDTSLNKIIQYGTAAERAAFTPDPAAGSQVLYIWFDSDSPPDTFIWDGAAWVQINPAAGGGIGDVTGPVGAENENIVVFDGVTGKYIQDSGQTIADVIAAATGGAGDVVGPAIAVNDRIATFDGTTGKLVQDGGQTIAQVISAAGDVDGPAVAVTDRIATFDGTTGKLIKDGGQTIAQVIAASGAGDVVGPGAAVTARVATFNGTTGKLIQDGGSTIADIIAAASGGGGDVTGPASAVNSNFALFSGSSGKVIEDSGFSAVSLIAAAAGVKLIKVNISDAQIQAWATTPIELIPAPGANKILVYLYHATEVNSTVNPGSTPAYSMFYNGDTQNLLGAAVNGSFNITGKRFLPVGFATNVNIAYSTFDPRNKSIILKGSSNPGGGNITLILNIAYYVADVA